MGSIKTVAVIGAGASGAAAAAALKAEDTCDIIRVFERRETAGGIWIFDPDAVSVPLRPGALPHELDPPPKIPSDLPRTTSHTPGNPYWQTPIYEELTTNVPDIAMSFTDLPFPYGPFVPHPVCKHYIESYFSWHQTDSNLVLNTAVEDVRRLEQGRWQLTLRRHDVALQCDKWWQEHFDALIVAGGHYSVPFMPAVKGLCEYMSTFPGRVEHSKTFRTARAYKGQRFLVIGNSASGHDVAKIISKKELAQSPLYISRRSQGRWDHDFSDDVEWKPVVESYDSSTDTINFEDGTTLKDIDKIIYCTGFYASYPFWKANGRPLYDYGNDVLINNYQHTFVHDFPTLAFIGLPRVLTFRSFEYQAIAIARLWSGRSTQSLPPVADQKRWFHNRLEAKRKEGRKFHQIEWEYGETMDWFRYLFELAGLPLLEGLGRCPPVLGAETRWAIEHIRKYPEKHPPKTEGGGDDEEWEMVEEKGVLHFI